MSAKSDTAKQLDVARKVIKSYEFQISRIILAFVVAERTKNNKQYRLAKNSLEDIIKHMIKATNEQVITEQKTTKIIMKMIK